MNIIELIRASAMKGPEPIVPGESVLVQPGDRILCNVPFDELTSVCRLGNNLKIIVGGLTVTEFKEFFSFDSTADPVIQFLDQKFSAANLQQLLTIELMLKNVNEIESQLFLLPGSFILAHPGDQFTVDAQIFAVKDLHRDGNDLRFYTHDEAARVVATIKEFFTAPEEELEAPQLRISDSRLGTTQDMIIHPNNPIFQWQGEPLPQAVVGTMYAYYFHLDAEDTDKMILVARATEGELPSWLTFSSLGRGDYLLSGLPTQTAVGAHAISIIAQSLEQGIGMHTQQAFNIVVRSADDIVSRSAADDVAAAEFRKAGETFSSENYLGVVSTVNEMPYMSMSEVAVIVGLPAVDMLKMQQEYSSTLTPEQILASKGIADQVDISPRTIVVHTLDSTTKAIEEEHTAAIKQETSHIINPAHVELISQPVSETAPVDTPEKTESSSNPVETAPPQATPEFMIVSPTTEPTPTDTTVSHNLLITSPPSAPPLPTYSTPPEAVGQLFTVDENSTNNSIVGTVIAVDADPGDVLTYSIYSGSTAFTIDPSTGVISVADMSQLDYESSPSFALGIQIDDLGGNHTQVTMTVNLINLNDNAPVVDLNGAASGINYAVNFTGSAVNLAASTATVSDADAPGFPNLQSIVVTITNDLDGSNEGLAYNFNLSGGGNVSGISLGNQISFGGPNLLVDMQSFLQNVVYFNDSTSPTIADRIITIQAYDGVNYSTIATTTVTYTANNQPLISPQSFSLDENSINNTVVGTVVATDTDPGDSVTNYTFIGGTGTSTFSINSLTGQITVLNSDNLNYETHTSFTLDVQVTDTHGAMSHALITIDVNNLNDNAPIVDLNGPGIGTDITVNYLGPTHLAGNNVSITDADAPGFPNLQSMTVTITNVLDPGSEILSYSFVDSNSVLQSGSSSTGTLTLTGPFSIADMQAFVKSLTYQDTALTPNTANRIITISANDGSNVSNIATVEVTHGFTFNDFNGTNGMIFIGDPVNYQGLAVTGADINADGYNDVIMTAPLVGSTGQIQVLFGGPNIASVGSGGIIHASDLNGVTGFVIYDSSGSHGFLGVIPGSAGVLGAAGDVNGDGVQDLLIGNYSNSPFLVFGAQNIGSTGSIDLNNFDGSQAFVITGTPGTVVGTVGDVNGDGFQDFFIGSPTSSQNGTLSGSAQIIFGSPTVNMSNVLDVSTLNGSNGFQFLGANAIDFAGYSVSSAGDINNDGYTDLAIGSFQSNQVYILFGGPTIGSSGTLQPSDINGTNGFIITNSSSTIYDRFLGSTVTNIGDVNGDGISDLLVDSPNIKDPSSPDGAVYIIFGSSALNSTGGSFDVATITPSTGAVFHSYSPIGYSSGVRAEASAAGDMNGDGLQDFAFSSVDRVTGLQKLYIIFGSTHLGSLSSNLNDLTPSEGLVIYATNSSQSITSISAIGDVNGDGIDDLAVGMGFSNINGTNSGETIIIFGGNFTNAITQLGDANNNIINGSAGVDRVYGAQGDDTINTYAGADYINGGSGNDIIFAGDGNDTVNGGAGNDTIHGGNNDDLLIGGPGADSIFGDAGNDRIVYENNENTVVDGGSGVDTLWIRNGNTAADLQGGIAVDLRGTSIYSNFEVIDLRGDTLAPTSVTLDIATVLSMTDAAHTLTIIGSAGDTVGFEPGEFTFVGSFITSFGAVNRYTGGGATVDVQTALGVSQVSTLDLDGNNSSGASGINYLTNFSSTPVHIADIDSTLTDPDGNIEQILVRITNLKDGAYESLSATATGNISVSYSPTGVLLLSGLDTPANYLSVLQSILYSNTSSTPNASDRLITFEVSDTGGVSHIATTTVHFHSGPVTYTLSNLMDGIHGFELTSNAAYAATSSIIYHDGDGFDNLLVANGFVAGNAPYARAFMIDGQATFISNAPFNDPSVTLTTFNNDSFASPIAAYGQLVSSIGDFNGDGINDIVISEFFGGPGHIVLGTSTGFTSPVIISTEGIPLLGNGTESVAALGDVNGDGLADFIQSNSSTGYGAVIFGTHSPGSSIDMMSLNGSDGFQIARPNPAFTSGTHDVSGANIDGDGKSDILVSYYDSGTQTGGIAVLLGSTPSFSSTVTITSSGITGADGFLITNSAGVPGSNNYLINPTDIGSFSGSSIDDIALSSKNTVYVIFGSAAFASATSFDVTSLNGSNGFSLTSSGPANITNIAAVNDVNGDGYSDFAFIDRSADSGLGAIFVIFGSASGFSANIDYTNLTPAQGFEITAGPAGLQSNNTVAGLLGYASVSGGGDLNGDGLGDIVITSGSHEYIVFGANFSGVITQMGGSTPGTIIGNPGNEVIYAGAADQTIIPGSGTNFINTGAGHDTISGNTNNGNNTIVYSPLNVAVNAGSGTNTLWLETDGNNVDFTTTTTTYTGLDIINLQALQTLTGNQITLNATTVQTISGANLLTVSGNAHDSVHLVGVDNWATTTPISGYTTYTSSTGSVINIQDGVKVTLSAHFISDATLDGTNGIVINPPASYSVPSLFGQTIDVVHNTLGNGFDDLFVNAPFGGLSFTGQAFLVPGTTTILPASTTIDDSALNSTLIYQGASGPFFSVADLSGFTSVGNHNLAFVTSGPHALVTLTAISSFVSPQDVNGLSVMDISNGPFNSMSVAAIGDMNGDGLTDLSLFSYWVPNVYVVFGTTTPPATLDLSADLTGANGFVVTNPAATSDNITNLTSVNINGDAFSDIAYHYIENVNAHDMVTVVLGKSAAFAASSTNTSLISGGQGFNITDNAHPYSNFNVPGFGAIMANAGDFNGDGINDLAIANPAIGTVYLVFGSPSLTTSFDVSSLNGANGFAFTTPVNDIITAMNFVGDVNGDGHADLAIATYNLISNTSDIYVEFGGDTSFSATMNIIPNTAAEGFVIHHYGPAGDNQIGAITSGDLNGDGLSDVIYSNSVGLYSSSPGAVYVIYGNNLSNTITHMGTSSGEIINGTSGDDTITGGAGVDTINGFGGNDFINGGSGADIINGGSGNDRIIYDPNDTSVNGGTGTDTLWFKDDSTFADLRGSSVFSGIDEIDLHALKTITGNQLTLNAAEVTAMSDANVLTVNGGGQDSLLLSAADGWSLSSPIVGYTTFTSMSGAVVNVENTLHYVHLV